MTHRKPTPDLEAEVRKIFVKHSMEKNPELELFDTDAIIKDTAFFIHQRERQARVDELERLMADYAEWYDEISKEHGVQQEVPHTAFHQLAEDRLKELNK